LDVDAALFWATVALVGVTIFYAIQTWRLVRVPYTPRLKATLRAHTVANGTHGHSIVIKNIGVGTAIDIKGKYSIAKIDHPITTTNYLKPNEGEISFHVTELPVLEEKNHYETNNMLIKINLECKNILNKKSKYKDILNASDFAIHFGTLTV
jgi:hypothetical protein